MIDVKSQPALLAPAAQSRHIVLDPEKVIVRMDRGKTVSTLEVDIEVPNGIERSLAMAAT